MSSSSTAAGSREERCPLDTRGGAVHDPHVLAALRTSVEVTTHTPVILDQRVVVELRGIKKSFGDIEVLHGVDLTVHTGEHVVIFGPSGSGKSTLLRTINLLEEPSEGSVRVLGIEYGPGLGGAKVKRGGPLQLRRHVGMVFQQFNLFPHLTALDNIAAVAL